jgi:hypothetical protein
VLQIGFSLCLASSVVFHFRLYQLNNHLRDSYPTMWKTFGSGNKDLSRLAQYAVITRLSTQYQVNDPDLNQRLVTLRRLHQSGAIGVLVVLAGVAWEVFF